MPTTQTNIAAEITRTLNVVARPGDTVEIRALGIPGHGRPHQASGYFRDFDAAGEAVAALEAENKPEGIYFVLNTVHPRCYPRSPDLLTPYPKQTTTDAEIVERRWLLVDLDPARPSGTSSTDEQMFGRKGD